MLAVAAGTFLYVSLVDLVREGGEREEGGREGGEGRGEGPIRVEWENTLQFDIFLPRNYISKWLLYTLAI